jgi:hypothetical protein
MHSIRLGSRVQFLAGDGEIIAGCLLQNLDEDGGVLEIDTNQLENSNRPQCAGKTELVVRGTS